MLGWADSIVGLALLVGIGGAAYPHSTSESPSTSVKMRGSGAAWWTSKFVAN